MGKTTYEEEALRLAKTIDIGNEALRQFPPEKMNVQLATDIHNDWKKSVLHPEPRYKNLASLRETQQMFLTYFQESSGPEVNFFWAQIREQGIGYKRVNKLAKILKRGKINNESEFDFVIDILVPYQQEGLIDKNEVALLNSFIGAFEAAYPRGKK